jgi:hypothetical protein
MGPPSHNANPRDGAQDITDHRFSKDFGILLGLTGTFLLVARMTPGSGMYCLSPLFANTHNVGVFADPFRCANQFQATHLHVVAQPAGERAGEFPPA